MTILAQNAPCASLPKGYRVPATNLKKWHPDAWRSRQEIDSAIYDRMLSILENKTLVDSKTGEILPPGTFSEKARQMLRNDGWSEREIAEEEQSILNSLRNHPNWTIQKNIPRSLYYELTVWDSTERKRVFKDPEVEQLVFGNRLVEIPRRLLNCLVCLQLLTMFDRCDVLRCPGFVEQDGLLLLDIDECYSWRGFLMPVIKQGLIRSLMVFRYPSDERPFRLRSRSREVSLAA